MDIAFCGAPAWVAFQDGDGAWTRAAGTGGGPLTTFHRTFDKTRAGIAVARDFSGGLTALLVLYGTPEELAMVSDTAGVACGTTTFKTLHGTVAGLGADEVARLSAGSGAPNAFVSAGTGPDFEIEGLVPGPHDILATRISRVNNEAVVTSVILRRTADLPDGAILSPLDFGSTEAFSPLVRTLTVGGVDAGGATAVVGLRTVHGTTEVLAVITNPTTATVAQFVTMPDAHLDPADLQSLTLTSAPATTVVRSSQVYFHSATDRTVAFGAIPSAPTFSVAAQTPTLRMRALFDVQPDYDRLTSIGYQQGANTIVAVVMTSAYASLNTGGYDLVVPELSGVPGFDQRWALRAGEHLTWTSSRTGGTLAPGFNAVPTDGAARRTATDGGSFTP